MLNLTCWIFPFFSHNPVTFFHIFALEKLTPTSSEKVNFYNFPHPFLHKIESHVSLDVRKCKNSEEGRGVYNVYAKKIKVFQGFVWDWRNYENFVNIVLILFVRCYFLFMSLLWWQKRLNVWVECYPTPHPFLHKIESHVSLDVRKCKNSEEGRGVYNVYAKKIKVF